LSEKSDHADYVRQVPGLDGLDDEAIQRLYGRWSPMAPDEVRVLFDRAPFPWWIAGGWAIEAAGGRARSHWDTDVVVLSRDLAGIREWFADWHLWEVQQGNLRPLMPGDRLSTGREQLWVRRDASSPWVLDLLLTPSEGNEWLYKRDPSVRLPLEEIGHSVASVPYLLPSLVLLFKAKASRPKDEADLVSLLPDVSRQQRQWLAEAIRKEKPDHPWLAKLDD
jgi:Aminoglycoside-2''-adenylyltransferase